MSQVYKEVTTFYVTRVCHFMSVAGNLNKVHFQSPVKYRVTKKQLRGEHDVSNTLFPTYVGRFGNFVYNFPHRVCVLL